MPGLDQNPRRPMSLDDVLGPCHRLGRLEFSPDGGRIIYEFRGALWRVDREGNSERLTEGRMPRWSPASDELAFLRGDPPQIWAHNAAGVERQRTAVPRGVVDYAWFADGLRFAVICPGEEIGSSESEKPLLDTIVELHRPKILPGSELWVVGVATGEACRVDAVEPGVKLADWANIAVHPSGEWLALGDESTPNKAEHVVVIHSVTGALRRPVPNLLRPCSDPQWSPDGARLAFLYSPHDYLYPIRKECAVVSWENGAPAGEIACYSESYFISEEGDELCWHPDGRTIFAIGIHGSTRQVLRIDLCSGVVQPLTQEPGWCGNLRLSRDGEWLAFTYTSPTCVGRLVLLPAQGGPGQLLLDVNEPWREVRFSEVELVHWRAGDGMELEGVLVKPPDYRPGRRYPLLLDLHSGPAPGGTALFNRSWHWLAAQGYLVFSSDFRGGQTYAWVDPLQYACEMDFLDAMAGVDFLIEAGYADPDRLGMYGFSYGAELTAWALGHTNRFRAAVVTCTGVDWQMIYGQVGGGGGSTLIALAMGGRPWEVPERYRDRSPLTAAHRATTPTLLFTGDAELGDIQMLYTWLYQAGVEVEALHYRGEGHGFSRPEHRRDWLERTLAWFDRHLQLSSTRLK